MNENANMAQRYEHEIPEGYEAKIDGDKVIIELKESEDEKIRQDIMEAVENWFPYDYERVEEIRDYLYFKKQKEQKGKATTEWPNMSNCSKNCKKCLAKCFYRKEPYEEKKPTDLWGDEDCKMIESINMVFDACAEKNIATEETTLYKLRAWLKSLPKRFNLQSKQEWGEEDEEILKDIIHSVNGYDAITGTIPQNFVQHEKKINWLKSIQPQSKEEWSEEDEEYLAACIDAIDNFYTLSGELKTLTNINVLRREYVEKLKSWLQSLRPQPKAEWSEEDRKHLDWIIEHFSQGGGIYDDLIYWLTQLPKRFNLQSKQEWGEEDKGMINCIISTLCEESHGGRETNERMVNWLEKLRKSLHPKPYWKPSEEQMKILFMTVQAYETCGFTTRSSILKQLYDDLQKLINSKD